MDELHDEPLPPGGVTHRATGPERLTMGAQPYLFFEGRCDEAIAFYTGALGAEVTALMRYSENPESCAGGFSPPPEKVMHASLRVGETEVMLSDGMCSGRADFKGFSLALSARNEADAKAKFGRLAEGGQVQMPLGPTFFSPSFGMVEDRFGVSWMVMVEPAAVPQTA